MVLFLLNLFVTIYGLYHYHECEVCGSVFLDNLPDFQNMYQEDNEVNGDIYMDDSVYETRVEMISAPKVEFVLELCEENAVKPSQWLDIGCGGGEIIFYLKRNTAINADL